MCSRSREHIPQEERDEKLRDQLVDPKVSGAAWMAWVVKGWQHLHDPLNDRLVLPSTVQATGDYQTSQDHLAVFIEERCVVGTDESCTFAVLKKAFLTWRIETGVHEEYSDTRLGKALDAKHFESFQHPESRARSRRGIGVIKAYVDGDTVNF
jgi:phage/plasmid-associated DNA primase